MCRKRHSQKLRRLRSKGCAFSIHHLHPQASHLRKDASVFSFALNFTYRKISYLVLIAAGIKPKPSNSSLEISRDLRNRLLIGILWLNVLIWIASLTLWPSIRRYRYADASCSRSLAESASTNYSDFLLSFFRGATGRHYGSCASSNSNCLQTCPESVSPGQVDDCALPM